MTGFYPDPSICEVNGKYDAIAVCHSAGRSDTFVEFMLDKICLTLDWALSLISGEDAYLSEQVRRLLDVMEYDVPYTAAQIMVALGLKSKGNLRELYIGLAIENGLVVMGMPDKPTSRNQMYMKTIMGSDIEIKSPRVQEDK